MSRSRPSMSTTSSLSLPYMPFIDVSTTLSVTNDLMVQAGRMWLDLWFANLGRASEAFWREARMR